MNITFTEAFNLFDLFVVVSLVFLFWGSLKRAGLRDEVKELRQELGWLSSKVDTNVRVIDALLAHLNLFASPQRKQEHIKIIEKGKAENDS